MINVLIVENNPTIVKILRHHLEELGCRVKTVENGLEALVELDGDLPDIIFTDIIMPKVSGDQLCSIIRHDRRLRDIFIAVHSSTSLEDNHQILEMDADVYIAKGPLTNLKEHVHRVLDQYRRGVRRNPKTIGDSHLRPREITKELLLERKHYQAVFNSVAEAVVELDSTGKVIQANRAAHRLFGKGSMDILSSSFADFLKGREKDKVISWISQVSSGTTSDYRSSFSSPLQVNKRKILLNLVAVEESEDFFIIGILQDITLQKTTEEKLAKTLGEFNAVIDTIDYGILLLDANLRARIANQAYRDLWQIPQSFLDDAPTLREIMEHISNSGIYPIAPEDMQEYIDQRIVAIEQGDVPPREIQRTDGKVLQFQCTVLPDNGRILTFFDITSLKNTEQKLEAALAKVSDLANHDPLTGLANLRLARENLNNAVALAKRKEWMAALMFIDLDGFKEVNDSHGHEIGDKVLKKVSERLLESLRETDTVARIGGDEFLVIQTEIHDRSAITKVAEKIVKKISQPFLVDDLEINIGASIGIAVYPNNGEDSRVLMKKADDALYYTKRTGKNNYAFTPG